MQERIDRAVAEHEEAKSKQLYREDGVRVYSDEEHAEREAQLEQEFQARMDTLQAEVDRQITRAEEALLLAENADPTDVLTTAELERANAKREFVSDEVWALSLEELERRCQAVLASGDRVNMFLYAHHAARRVGEMGDPVSTYLAQKRGDGDPFLESRSEEPGSEGVRGVVAQLKARLDPEGEKKREEARKALEAAQESKNYAYYRKRGAKNAVDLYLQQKHHRGSRTGVSVADSVTQRTAL